MKKKISILLTSLATLIILFSATIAHHHHHHGWVHVVMDFCSMTDCEVDHGSQHCHDLDHQESYDQDCVFEKEYVSASSEDLKLGNIEKYHIFNSFLLFYINDNRLKKFNNEEAEIIYKSYVLPYVASYISFSKGLRSPPQLSFSILV